MTDEGPELKDLISCFTAFLLSKFINMIHQNNSREVHQVKQTNIGQLSYFHIPHISTFSFPGPRKMRRETAVFLRTYFMCTNISQTSQAI
jgi:hypothetical protein